MFTVFEVIILECQAFELKNFNNSLSVKIPTITVFNCVYPDSRRTKYLMDFNYHES